jgi:prevent-host-death family protein
MLIKTKDLRTKLGRVIKRIRKGEEVTVTYRGEPVAVMKPIPKEEEKAFEPIGFGIWAKRDDLKNVEEWVREKRRARYTK